MNNYDPTCANQRPNDEKVYKARLTQRKDFISQDDIC
jgi:hypothetical protein